VKAVTRLLKAEALEAEATKEKEGTCAQPGSCVIG
jgi:hypothetical protein